MNHSLVRKTCVLLSLRGGLRQAVLLLLAVFSIPVLLCAKPCVIRNRMKKAEREDSFSSQSHLVGEHGGGHGHKEDGHEDDGHGGHDDHDFSEILIHQVRGVRGRAWGGLREGEKETS